MDKYVHVFPKYRRLGVSEDNIEFAISSVEDGSKREHILETLTADYRGVDAKTADAMLTDIFEAYGGEFKQENRGGYLYGALFCIAGIAGMSIAVAMVLSGNYMSKFLVISGSMGLIGCTWGTMLIVRAIKGKYRDDTNPMNALD